ncbi:guanine nucleotide-binding protein subunit alpha [Phanerochaete sordida]|uniref:Guanine nucleotide-binding protein subunit alpha n=1 Tax=Phanerochaete sordida TaxID=48140 RepID=A0A9P3LCB2_9APHY|nr:guanine nucleotide-binding protein subunit alpha [Phanerochaete sordida]
MGLITDIDPLALALAPPADESDQQRVQRLQEEERARRVSEEIDEQLRKEGAALKKQKKPIKVLLLGQSESGKSTTLKNFQLAYAANAWAEERLAWKTVIQLNLIRHVTIILEHLSQDMNASTSEESGSDSDEPARPSRSSSASSLPLRFTEKHRLLKLRLAPLRSVQDDLQARLGASDWPAPAPGSEPRSKMQDFFVRSNAGWKSSLRPGKRSPERSRRKQDEDNETGEVLTGCAEDIKALWADDVIQDMLRRRKLRLDLLPGFFLHERDVDRIAKRDYTPSDDDVVRSRLRTLGVQEHRIHFETGPAAGTEWCLYDVGGSRTQRAAWFPYFDDCDAIIFLAPISCFDEKLAEDRRVNRLEDSYQLWKMICANKLLSKAQIILFLNKCDLLDKKLKSGVRVRDFVPSFGDRKNDLQTVAQYFAQHFKEIAKSHASALRPFRVHLTSVVDTKATALTLGIVGESILRTQLRDADLL